MNRAKFKIIMTMTGAVVVLVISMVCLSILNGRDAYENSVEMNDGWTVGYYKTDAPDLALETDTDVNLDGYKLAYANRGDIVKITNTIPDKKMNSPMIRVWTYHSTVDVYVEGEQVYTYGHDEYEKEEMLGSGFYWINLPRDCEGKEIQIVFWFSEDDALSTLYSPYYGEEMDAIPDLISDNFTHMCASIFLIVFGICIIVIGIIMTFMSKQFRSLIYVGWFAIVIGVWTLCGKGLIQVVADDRILRMWCEYFALYVGPLPAILFLKNIKTGAHNKYFKMLVNGLISVNIILLVVTLILHFTNILHFSNMLPYYHILDLIVVVYFIVSSIYYINKDKHISYKILLIGTLALAACFGLDILIYNLEKYVYTISKSISGVSAWGGIAFIICMLFSFGTSLYSGAVTKMEQAALIKMAYTDALTNLNNRAKYDEVLSQLIDIHRDYTMINFDLNDLKKTNDSYGHINGDMLLCAFANVLKEAFEGCAVVSRIGGDEFNIIIEECDRVKTHKYMEKYEKQLAKENEKDYDFQISAAYGIAYSDEAQSNTGRTISRIADKRMYEMKSNMKVGRE